MKWDLRTGVKKMNKLEQLINERCPNGVDYKKIKYEPNFSRHMLRYNK